MAGMELNREDDSHFSGYKEDFSILTPDYMWPDAVAAQHRLTVPAKVTRLSLSSVK